MPPEKHALLSASSASRWLKCTAAPRFEEGLPENTSEYAEEGRLAHAIGELKVLKKCTPMSTRTYNTRLNKLKKKPLYDPEMDKTTDLYSGVFYDRFIRGLWVVAEGLIYTMFNKDFHVVPDAPRPYADMEGIGERWTRNPDGTTKKIPANTTFDEWRQSFVQGPTPGLQTQAPGVTITAKTTPHFQNVVRGLPSAPSGYTDALEQHYAAGNQTAQAVFERYVQPGSVADGAFSGTPHFDSRIQKVKMNFAADMKDPRGPATTFFHEHGHFVDFTSCAGSGYTSLQTPDFGDALKKDFEAYVKATMKANGTRKKTDAYTIIARELMDADHNAISDLFGGLSRNKARGNYGHATRYWTYYGMLEKEAFAHMFAAQFDAGRYALMQKYFPTALAEFEKLLKGVI